MRLYFAVSVSPTGLLLVRTSLVAVMNHINKIRARTSTENVKSKEPAYIGMWITNK